MYYMFAYAFCAIAFAMVLPNVLAFRSIASGLAFIDWFYPYPQNHAHFRAHFATIRAHVLLNGAALAAVALYFALGPAAFGSRPGEAGYFDWGYAVTLSVGSAFGVRFSARNAGHGVVGTASFACMALASVTPAWLALWAPTDDARRRWLVRRGVITRKPQKAGARY